MRVDLSRKYADLQARSKPAGGMDFAAARERARLRAEKRREWGVLRSS